MPRTPTSGCRHLILVLGDQLDPDSAVYDGIDPGRDVVWMVEAAQESTKVWTSKPRIALFLAAMRHHAEALRSRGFAVQYHRLGAHPSLTGALKATLKELQPTRVLWVSAGEWQVQADLEAVVRAFGCPFELRPDRHFLCTPEQFAHHARGRKQLRMEFFYREMRQSTGILVRDGKPEGGEWNFDAENRQSFGKEGPELHLPPKRFQPDGITRDVIQTVETNFATHPGELRAFDWPVTPLEAQQALDDFIEHRLPGFGQFQDAMWTGEPWLFHSRLSAALNLKLIHPRTVVLAAEQAYRESKVPLAAAEGFIRQILGWREYVRGVYWLYMPGYIGRNALGASEPLPDFYWTAKTDMQCLHHALRQTLELGYAHHIQRLMVTGLYALLLGVDPKAVHQWYLAVYVDAVEWVELPNTLGMSQYADGGVMASKPYIASGKYIDRMSNYCKGCRYDPAESTGPKACPFTTLYWDFLIRHEATLQSNPRMVMQVRNLQRLNAAKRQAISDAATQHRSTVQAETPPSK